MSDYQLPTTRSGPGIGAIVDKLWRRRIVAIPWHEAAREMSDHYNNRIVVPLPELDADEKPAAANLIAQNLDQHAMRVASVQPTKMVAPLAATASAEKLARRQTLVLDRYDETNQMSIMDGRRARWLATWSCAPTAIRPDPVKREPRWELRNPLGTYPAPLLRYDDMRPTDVIFTYVQNYGWLRENHPMVARAMAAGLTTGRQFKDDDLFELVEYEDAGVNVLGLLGTSPAPMLNFLDEQNIPAIALPPNAKGQMYAVELLRTPNLAGMCTAVIAKRVTLDAPKGLADDMVGIFQMQTKMLALEVNAVARAIYPDTWFIEGPQGGRIETMADGLTGTLGHISGGGTIQELRMTPGTQTMGIIDALERNARVAGHTPSEFSGESTTNVRTAQRGLDIASSAIGFYIQEDQRVIGQAKQYEYEIAAAVDRGYFKNQSKSFFVFFGQERGHQDYKPGELWQTIPEIRVRYNYAGMDIAGITNLLGQQIGMGIASRETAMQHMPYVTDYHAERGKIIADHLEDALLSSIQQQGASGQITPEDLAQIELYVQSGDYKLSEAVQKVHEEAQARQASTTGTAQPGSPQAQVGLQGGPQGAAQPTIAGPNQSQMNLKDLISALAAGR